MGENQTLKRKDDEMKWSQIYAPYTAWETRMEEWCKNQPEYQGIVNPTDFYRANSNNMKGWRKQAMENKRIADMLRMRYNDDIEQCPNIQTLTIC